MGFIKETYTNGNAGLMVNFTLAENTDTYFSGDSVEEAMAYFGMYLDEYKNLKIGSDSERAMDVLEIEPTEAVAFREQVDTLIATLDDEAAVECMILFPSWDAKNQYKAGDRIRYQDVLYKVLQDHTAQADWAPNVASGLFAKVLNETEDGSIPEWVQPDSTNGFMMGDQVYHNGILYTSLVDNNTWEPGVVGSESLWEAEQTDVIEPEEQEPAIAEFEVGHVYMMNDQVMFNEAIYTSLIDNNSWSPADYPAGWEIVAE